MISRVSTDNNSHEKAKPFSYEPITNYFIPNYSQHLISNPLMTSYLAASVIGSDGNLYAIQRIENVPTPASVFWIRRWNHILELLKSGNPGLLNYFACHMEKNANAETSIVYMISEYTANTLRAAKDKLNLSLADVIRAMFQVSESLIDLKKQGHFHHCINPDTIFVIENQDRTLSYKLGNLGAWMKTHEVDYDERPEYGHLLPQDFDPLNKDSKSDVYSLGITIMEIIGVNIDTLMAHKTKEVDPKYQHDTSYLRGTLRKLLLEAVHPDPEKRLSLESLHDQLSSIVANLRDGDLDYDTCRAALEDIPYVPYKDYGDRLRQKNHLPEINIGANRKEIKETEVLIISRSTKTKLESPHANQEIETNSRCQEDKNNIVEIKQQPPLPVAELKTVHIKKKKKKSACKRVSECTEKCIDRIMDLDCRKCILWILGISALLFQFAMPIAIMVVHYGSDVANSEDLEGGISGIYRNLVLAPISDITFDSPCLSGYTKVNLGTWPGTVSFCYDDEHIETYSCYDSEDFDTSCNYYDCRNREYSLGSEEYTIWRNTSVCVKRIEQVSNASSCPSGYVKCYTGVCAKGTDCGITEIHFESSARTDPGWFSTQYNSSAFANYRKDVGVRPISSFAIAHGQPTVCINRDAYGVQNNYAAIKIEANGCGRYGDFPGVAQLDNDLSTTIFEAQSWGYGPSNRPEFVEQVGENDQQGYLIAIPRLEINNLSPCLTFNLQGFLDGADKVRSSRASSTAGFIITINVFLGIGIISSIIGAKQGGVVTAAVVFWCCVLIITIITTTAAAVLAKSYGDTAAFQENIASVPNSKCFVDPDAQQVITDYVNTSAYVDRIASLWIGYTIGCWTSLVVAAIALLNLTNIKF